MDSEQPDARRRVADLGTRWEIVDTGITVKLYPSCAGTHPTLDAILDCAARTVHRRRVERVEVDVDAMTPTVLIYDRPATGLEAKFSMPFCAAAAVVGGRVGIDTFEPARIADPAIRRSCARVTMPVDPSLDASAPPLTQARVTIQLRDGRVLTAAANGARGYPTHPASDDGARRRSSSRARAGRCPTTRPRGRSGRCAATERLADVRS